MPLCYKKYQFLYLIQIRNTPPPLNQLNHLIYNEINLDKIKSDKKKSSKTFFYKKTDFNPNIKLFSRH